MLSRRRATVVVRANWWDGGRLEHLVGRSRYAAECAHRDLIDYVGRAFTLEALLI